ncbi:MAG: PQQ-binding-like beta-propeller repeat protein [Planctomycetaceae bacterium]
MRHLLLLLELFVCQAQEPSDWPQWRGPSGNGVAAANANPPVEWSATKNMAWAASLPGKGSATPIVIGKQVIVLSAEATDRPAEKPPVKRADSKTEPPAVYYKFWVTSIDRSTGDTLWQKLATEQVPHEGTHPTHTYAAGSPVTDGQTIYCSFGSRGIFAYSLTGELLWQKDLGDLNTRFGWGEAVTPALAGELLIVNWDQEEGSFIVALDRATGEERWRKDRPGEATSWNAPLITTVGDRTVAVVNGSGKARAYDCASGDVLWECGGQTTNAIPSAIKFEDTVVLMSGYKGAAAFAIPLDAKGDVTGTTHIRWSHHEGTPYVPSPGVSGDRLFFTGGNNDILTVLDLKTGKPLIQKQRLGIGNTYASPLVAAGRVYFVGREGTAVVIRDSGEILSRNVIEDTFDASPVACDDQLFLRSWTKLYCVQQK